MNNALRDRNWTIAKSGSDVVVKCDSGDDALAVFNWLTEFASMIDSNSSDCSSAFDILPRLLDIGCKISKQDGEWWIFDRGGNGVVSGKTFREMCEKLENVDIEANERQYHEHCRRFGK